ncbi:GntR family transcriptional regulator [Terrabacter sp. MAHUQ-38]|uniref:GntR family transcriptional regulator n=1 Tax=unclassified Terrabacter TaxID=2630222 RepID=UPI00165E21E2|nr:GntR family transcriptional regulator [Terrabacter sp. MAHUQ-38]MBC9822523.1 GntR family transcriptional regulator [Terrabacter sp. MAHUQ-38]
MERMRRASGGQVVYAELRRRILSLELQPGQRLYEPELAATLQVSRTPLREALRLLLAEDLIDQLPTGGMVVRPLAASDIEELYSVRAALEGLMTGEAARRLTDDDVAVLRGLVERNARMVGDAEDAMRAGHDLHLRIAEVAGHGWARRLHAQVDGHMSRYRPFTNESQDRRTAALAEHRAIVEALVARDADEARRLAESHVLAARDVALEAIGARLAAPR